MVIYSTAAFSERMEKKDRKESKKPPSIQVWEKYFLGRHALKRSNLDNSPSGNSVILPGMHYLGLKDLFVTPILVGIIYFVALGFRQRFYEDSTLKKYFVPALMVKIFGGIATVIIYESYYGGGDMTYYFSDG